MPRVQRRQHVQRERPTSLHQKRRRHYHQGVKTARESTPPFIWQNLSFSSSALRRARQRRVQWRRAAFPDLPPAEKETAALTVSTNPFLLQGTPGRRPTSAGRSVSKFGIRFSNSRSIFCLIYVKYLRGSINNQTISSDKFR